MNNLLSKLIPLSLGAFVLGYVYSKREPVAAPPDKTTTPPATTTTTTTSTAPGGASTTTSSPAKDLAEKQAANLLILSKAPLGRRRHISSSEVMASANALVAVGGDGALIQELKALASQLQVLEGKFAPPTPPSAATSLTTYNLDKVNAYRASKGVAPLVIDPALSAFALTGSERLSDDHAPHANFKFEAGTDPAFAGAHVWAENQGDPNGVRKLDADPTVNTQKQIDLMLKLMWDEGPGDAATGHGHYDNMMNPAFTRMGVGLYSRDGVLYMTNDFAG